MSRIENSKLAVIGAGSVGTSLAYAALIRGSARTVALYDVNAAKVEAEVLDLAHGTQFTGAGQVIGGADRAVIAGAHMVVITAGAKQDPGQTRLDLAETNVQILRSLLPQLLEHAPHAIYCIVTNPCDVLTVAAAQISGLSPHRVFSSGTVLDTSRLRRMIADRAEVSAMSVSADIIGEHGDTGFALWSQARIGPVPLLEWRSPNGYVFSRAELDGMTAQVRSAAYQVIAGKGATNYAIGLAGARIVEAVLQDQKAVLPVGTLHPDHPGVSDVAFSMPSIVGAEGVEEILQVPMTEEESAHLQASVRTLRQAQEALGIR